MLHTMNLHSDPRYNRFSLLLITILFALPAIGQKQNEIFKDGLKAGLVYAKYHAKDNFGNYTSRLSWKPGFTFGFTGLRNVSDNTAFEIGFLCTSKGFKETLTTPASTVNSNSPASQLQEASVNTINIDVPLNLIITRPVSPRTSIHLAVGPYLGIGLFGDITRSIYVNNRYIDTKEKIKWNLKEYSYGLRRIDYGLSMRIGTTINRIQLAVEYTHGLANITASTKSGFRLSNRLIGVTATIYM